MATTKRGLYYKKDKKAQIYQYHEGEKDSSGFYTDDYYTPLAPAPLWCYAKQLTQEQLYAAYTYWNKETRLFVFNYRSDVKQYQLIEYENDWYEITRVDRTDDYNGELFVYAKNCNASNRGNIKPYGWKPGDN